MERLLVKNVTYSYQTKYHTIRALNGINTEFELGKLYVITGPSGCGKTTLLSLLAGLDVPEKGSIEWKGETTSTMDRDRFRQDNVSVIFQNYNLFHHLTMLENAAYPLYIRNMPKKEADNVACKKLLVVGLKESQFNRLPNMLSGGEQQRIAIARALVSGSRIILADEPTGNLDSENSKNIVGILKRLAHEENCCVIIVTHDFSVASEADIVYKMCDGRIEKSTDSSLHIMQ